MKTTDQNTRHSAKISSNSYTSFLIIAKKYVALQYNNNKKKLFNSYTRHRYKIPKHKHFIYTGNLFF